MMAQLETPAPRTRSDHGCFGCGDQNPCGLRLVFAQTDDGVRASVTPRPQDQGFLGVVHGGIVSTMLDEAMARAAFTHGVWAVTGKLDVRFRQPVEVGVEVLVVGRVLAHRGRLVDASGEIRRATDAELLAQATGLFVRVPEARAREWEERYLLSPG
ncbi:MAG TPA: PaaI family thioesterase [Thermomicrobiales bacterium]|nr:PaaI family thioesterase [Thermomicrobiales bacterium]